MSYFGVVSATIAINERILSGKTRAEIIAGATAAAQVDKNYRVAVPSASTLMLTWRHRPTWAIIIGVIGLLVFLIGALFFLVKDTDTITITAVDEPAGVRVSAIGSGSQEMVEFLQGFLDPAVTI